MKSARHILRTAALAALLCAATHARAGALLDETYDNAPAGAVPPAATAYSPRKNTPALSVSIVEGPANTAGSGKAVRIHDNDPKAAALEYNIVAGEADQKSAVRISFDIAWTQPPEGQPKMSMSFGTGAFAGGKVALAAQANRHFTASFYANGAARFTAGPSRKSKTLRLGPSGKANRLDIYLNDAPAPVTANAPGGEPLNIEADSMVVYQNGRQIFSSKVDKFAGAEKQIGRIGFVTTTAAAGLDFVIDNLRVETLGQ